MISTKQIAAILLLIVVALSDAFGAEDKPGPKSIAELQIAIEKVLKETKTPGAGVAIVSRDKVEWVAGIGKADVEKETPVTENTLFRIGSTSKVFAALAALKLQQEGKLKISDTVRQWVPEVAFTNPWEATDPVRLVHLMEHTSGFDDMHLREWAHNDPTPIALKDALAFGAASRVSRWRPGSRMAYCNSAPAVMAAVIEKASGQRFEDYVQENFFRPLGMNTASYFLTPETSRLLTKLYHPDGVTPYPYWHLIYRATGSINASVSDMANFVRFFLQRGSLDGIQLLEPALIERMERTETLAAAKLGDFAGYGLYNHAIFMGPFVFRGHGGAIMGAMTEMAYLPEYGRGYVVMINSGSPRAIYQINLLLRTYVIRELTPPAAPAAASIPVELQRQYSGYYQIASPRDQWLYGFERLINLKQLAFSSNGVTTSTFGYWKERWVPVSDRLLRKDNQSVATLALLPDTDGELLIQAGWETFKQVSAWRVWAQLIAIVVISLLIGSVLLFAPVWMFAALFGKFRNVGPLSLRVMPLVTTVLLLTFELLLASALRGMLTVSYVDDVLKLGIPTWFTVSIMLSSAGFALATLASLYVVYRERSAAVNRFLYWHSVMVSVAMAAVSIYFGYWGLIGVRLWA